MIEAVERVLSDPALRARLAEGGRAAARRTTWERAVDVQERIYREALASRTAVTKASTEGP